jgi:hypothetical protein
MSQETIEASIARRIEAYWMQRGHKVAVRVTGAGSEIGVRSTLAAGLPERYEPTNGDVSLAVGLAKP